MNTLFVSPAYAPAWQYGGVVASWSRILEEMAAQGENVTVFTTDAGLPDDNAGKRQEACALNGVEVHYFRCDSKSPILSRALTEAARERIREFDLLHLAGIWQPSSIGVRRASVAAGVPYVVSFHGALDLWPRRQKRLKKFVYYMFAERSNIRNAEAIRVTSRMELEWSRKFARPGQEIRVISNGIDLASWQRVSESAGRWRTDVGISPKSFLFLNVGRLHRKKNLELAIQALASLHSREWHMAFVGDDEDGTGVKLERMACELGIKDKISFHPTIPSHALPAVYSAADLFLLPSHHENFGNVVLEALVCECPVLISDQVGIWPDLDGIRGVAVRERELSTWTKALADAMNGETEFKICRNDRDELDRRFSIKTAARKMMDFHCGVLERVHGRETQGSL
jgi:glycosyltransferase involved in cell wall biosynthesis